MKLAVILHFNACSRSICICHNVYGSYGDYVDCGAKKKNAGSAIQAMNTTKNFQGSLSQDYRLSHIQEATHLKLFCLAFELITTQTEVISACENYFHLRLLYSS